MRWRSPQTAPHPKCTWKAKGAGKGSKRVQEEVGMRPWPPTNTASWWATKQFNLGVEVYYNRSLYPKHRQTARGTARLFL